MMPGAAASSHDAVVDVLVIGAGGCGLVAALAANDLGAEVAVVEKQDRPMGNTVLSSGSIPGAGTRFQRAAGIVDSPDLYMADLAAVTGPHEALHLTERLAGHSARLVEWLVDRAGIELTLIDTYKHVGHSVHRLHAPPDRRGETLMAGLLKAADARGIPVAFGNPARELLVEGGRVVGAVTETAHGETARIAAAAVVLAVNGFAAAPDLLAAHCPVAAAAPYAGAPGSQGEALRWGAALGAGFGNLGAYQAHASFADPHGTLVTWTVVEKGGIVVDATGTRFGDETLGYSAFADEELARTGPFFVIYDDRIAEMVGAGQPDFAELGALGGFAAGDSAEALAARIGADPDLLADTLAETALAADGTLACPFGRTAWGGGLSHTHLRATRIAPAVLHTQGGLMVDREARVLTAGGEPIAGLYAGGGAAVGISGLSGSRGYASGNGLLGALGLGHIAGTAAVRDRLSAAA